MSDTGAAIIGSSIVILSWGIGKGLEAIAKAIRDAIPKTIDVNHRTVITAPNSHQDGAR